MPTYHFNLADHERITDDEGTDLPNDAEARVQAVVFAGDYLSDVPQMLDDGAEFRVEVTDDDGRPVVTVVVRAFQPVSA